MTEQAIEILMISAGAFCCGFVAGAYSTLVNLRHHRRL